MYVHFDCAMTRTKRRTIQPSYGKTSRKPCANTKASTSTLQLRVHEIVSKHILACVRQCRQRRFIIEYLQSNGHIHGNQPFQFIFE